MDNTLRGDPHELISVPQTRIHGYRENGSPKGTGYFGPLALVDEEEIYTAELPSKIGTGVLIPLVVPTLTRAELTHLVAGGRSTPTIKDKAWAHAQSRLAQGLDPFCTLEEIPHPLPD